MREALALQRAGRDSMCVGEIGFGVEQQLVGDGTNPAPRQLPQCAAKIGAARFFGQIGPELRCRRTARDRLTAELE